MIGLWGSRCHRGQLGAQRPAAALCQAQEGSRRLVSCRRLQAPHAARASPCAHADASQAAAEPQRASTEPSCAPSPKPKRRRRQQGQQGKAGSRIPWSSHHAAVLQAVRERELIPQGSNVLVAVSGGQDSMALMQLLLDMQKHLGIQQLVVAHCDHGVRPDSHDNARFVLEAAERLGLPAAVRGTVTGVDDGQDLSKEAVARSWRYDQLAVMAQSAGCSVVVTGHTASDRAETLLFNIARGSGLDGLAAMRWRKPLAPGVVLARPLLCLTRQQTLEVVQQAGLQVYEDSTNQDLRYSRNRIRLQVMPQLLQLNSQAHRHIAQLAEVAAEEVSYLNHTARAALEVLRWPAAELEHHYALHRAILGAGPRHDAVGTHWGSQQQQQQQKEEEEEQQQKEQQQQQRKEEEEEQQQQQQQRWQRQRSRGERRQEQEEAAGGRELQRLQQQQQQPVDILQCLLEQQEVMLQRLVGSTQHAGGRVLPYQLEGRQPWQQMLQQEGEESPPAAAAAGPVDLAVAHTTITNSSSRSADSCSSRSHCRSSTGRGSGESTLEFRIGQIGVMSSSPGSAADSSRQDHLLGWQQLQEDTSEASIGTATPWQRTRPAERAAAEGAAGVAVEEEDEPEPAHVGAPGRCVVSAFVTAPMTADMEGSSSGSSSSSSDKDGDSGSSSSTWERHDHEARLRVKLSFAMALARVWQEQVEQLMGDLAATYAEQQQQLGGRLPVAPLHGMPLPLQRRVLRLWLHEQLQATPSAEQLHSVVRLLGPNVPGGSKSGSLGTGACVVRRKGWLELVV